MNEAELFNYTVEILEYETDETIFHKDNKARFFGQIKKGRVNMITPYGIFVFREGDFIGLPDCFIGNYSNDYIADGDLELNRYTFEDAELLGGFLSANPELLRPALDSYLLFSSRLLNIFKVLLDLNMKMHNRLKIDYDIVQKTAASNKMENVIQCREIERLNPEYKYGLPSKEQFDFMEEFKGLVQNPAGKIDVAPQISAVLMEKQGRILSVMKVNCDNMFTFLQKMCQLYFGKGEKSLFTQYYAMMHYMIVKNNADPVPYIEELMSLLDYAKKFSVYWTNEISGQCPVDYNRLEHICAPFLPAKSDEAEEEKADKNEEAKAEGVEESKEKAEGKEGGEESEKAEESEKTEKSEKAANDLESHKKKMDALQDLMETLFKFAEYDDEKKGHFLEVYEMYMKQVEDKFHAPDANRHIRAMEEEYYELYLALFLQAEKRGKMPLAVRLCLDYGIVSEKLFEIADLIPLTEIVSKGIYKDRYKLYTMSQWLHLIYSGKREPSKNDMDMDYKELLKDLKRSKSFTKEEEQAYLNDSVAKVSFEIKQMFRSNNRMVYGSNATFCPFIRGDEFGADISKQLIKGEDFEEAMNNILKVDFSAFHRQTIVHFEQPKSENVLLIKEILPEIILIPNIGQRGFMWQEIADRKKSNPARFTFPLYPFGNIQEMLYPVIAKYRWEYTRTDEGMRWNDVTEHSLTAEYYQYIQFYKKNSSLPDAVKQKIKERLNAHKPPQDFFENDYISWIKYESAGASRLNKVTREILSTYVPFSIEYRNKLRENPMFGDFINHYEIKTAHKVKLIEQRMANCKRNGVEIPVEMEDHLRYLKS